MLVSSCFPLLSSLSTKPKSRGQVANLFLTIWHRPRCHKYPQPHISFCHCHIWIQFERLFCLLAPRLWYSALGVICKKYYKFFFFLIAQFYRPTILSDVRFGKYQKTLIQAFDCTWFWCICCFAKSCYWDHSF